MAEENKNYEEDQDYLEDFDDTFSIGIPIEKTMNTLQSSGSPDIEPDIEPDQETEDAEKHIEKNIPDEALSAPSPFDEIKDQLSGLSQAFDNKLKYDEHKNKIINDLHQSLQEYREGLVKKYLLRIITDMIKIIDDMRKFASHYSAERSLDQSPEKLLEYIKDLASDLEDLVSWEGVIPFTCKENMVNPSRQRILNKIETNDPAKDKTVAERLRPGYEWDGKVIRPEMVSAYIYQTESTAEDNNN